MKKKRELTKEDGIKIREYRKEIQDKRTDRRMLAVQQRSEGKRNKDIAEILGVDPRIVSQWVRMYLEGGIEALLPKKKSGRPPQLTYQQEELLNEFRDKAEAGQIYRVLHRHGWRKIKPRSRHPKKESPEAIEASKKLNLS